MVASVVVLVVLALVLPAVTICRDWAFVDRNTGSRKGYREWPFGCRTGEWYQETALETFMRSNQPAEFQQRWMSYAGTGRNVFGGATIHGHGRPGRIIHLMPDMITDYCAGASDAEKRGLYEVFASGEPAHVNALVMKVNDTVVSHRQETPGRSHPANRAKSVQ